MKPTQLLYREFRKPRKTDHNIF